MAVAEPISEADPRLWLNARDIAEAVGRAESTIYDALDGFTTWSRSVGRERRYPWMVSCQLAYRYAVPVSELYGRCASVLDRRASEVGADPKDVRNLFLLVCNSWLQTADSRMEHGPWQAATQRGGLTKSQSEGGQNEMLSAALAAIRSGRVAKIPRRFVGDPDLLLVARDAEGISSGTASNFAEERAQQEVQRTSFRPKRRR